MVPLKDCMQDIQEDNKKMKVLIVDEIKKLDDFQKMTDTNIKIIET